MPFITNDFHHLLVDDEDYYDKNPGKYKHYVVARRLLVTSQKSFTVKVSVQQILDHQNPPS